MMPGFSRRVDLVGFQDRQGVHVGPDGDPGFAFTQVGDHADAANAGSLPAAQLFQYRRGPCGGVYLLKSQLGVVVNQAPPGD
jgi:hypothetical protein